MTSWRILVTLAWRNLFSHKGKNTVVGLIMMFGTFLVVLGTSLLDSIERSMSHSITDSVAGHLQVFDRDARDPLALFGGGFMGQSDIGVIPDFARVKEVLGKVPNVKAVVPMGSDMAEFYSATQLDRTVEALRKALEASDRDRAEAQAAKIRNQAALMEEEYQNRMALQKNRAEIERQLADIRRVRSPGFWQDLWSEPEGTTQFLDTRLAPLVDEYEMLFMRYLGTDLDLFVQNFDTFRIVHGEMVPSGHRGLLVSQKFYDDFLRNRVARELDKLKVEVIDRGRRIDRDPLLRAQVERMARQYRRITFQLEPAQARALESRLRELLPGERGNLEELVQAFLRVDDETLPERHRIFFAEIVPMIQLYVFDIGDVITIRAYTKSGYVKSINLKVYGTYSFAGLESSDLAGAFNLMDMLSFRDLYGMMTEEKRRELAAIQREVGLEAVPADRAEDALFGGGGPIEGTLEDAGRFDEFAGVDLKKTEIDGRPVHDTTFTQADIDRGVALNAALILTDPARLEESRAAVEGAIASSGLRLQVVDWQTAAGLVGQMVVLVRVVLYIAIFIIFMVAVVIINNTMVLATMERTIEIGTIRAMGGPRRFVLTLFLSETLLLGLVSGALGALLGAGAVRYLGRIGIPAVADVLVFLFSGPRLHPSVGAANLAIASGVILAVSLLATFYPAFVAARIQPVVAMQARE